MIQITIPDFLYGSMYIFIKRFVTLPAFFLAFLNVYALLCSLLLNSLCFFRFSILIIAAHIPL